MEWKKILAFWRVINWLQVYTTLTYFKFFIEKKNMVICFKKWGIGFWLVLYQSASSNIHTHHGLCKFSYCLSNCGTALKVLCWFNLIPYQNTKSIPWSPWYLCLLYTHSGLHSCCFIKVPQSWKYLQTTVVLQTSKRWEVILMILLSIFVSPFPPMTLHRMEFYK